MSNLEESEMLPIHMKFIQESTYLRKYLRQKIFKKKSHYLSTNSI